MADATNSHLPCCYDSLALSPSGELSPNGSKSPKRKPRVIHRAEEVCNFMLWHPPFFPALTGSRRGVQPIAFGLAAIWLSAGVWAPPAAAAPPPLLIPGAETFLPEEGAPA